MVSYGIEDKHCGNINIKLTLQSEVDQIGCGYFVEKGLDIDVDGEKQKVNRNGNQFDQRSIKIDGDVKASLASTPVKHLLRDLQKYLSIAYDTVRGRLTMKYDGTDAEKLPPAKMDQLIYQNKIVDATVNDQR